ncbi:MAG: threonine--tRNA ligase [Candidatus Pacearchaeota archaeon]
MKILSLHCDYIRFKVTKKAIREPEILEEEQKESKTIKEVLVIFIAVEKVDENNKESISWLIQNIEDIAKKVNTRNIVLYPYAHLSANLSSHEFAINILKEAEKKLIEKNYKVNRAPFGYYKEFELKCKGHPIAELSRRTDYGHEKTEVENIEKEYDYKKLLNSISKSKLDTSKLKENDHRILGQRMDLFSFHDVAPGMVFFHHNGMIIYNELINYWREEHQKEGYLEISTPQILDKRLWQISGHWEKYRENIFITEYESKKFAVKPMNCPGGILVFKSKIRSYNDLPIKMSELGTVHRKELSGVLAGLFRLIKFTQDDAHIYCTEEQIENEIMSIMNIVNRFYNLFRFEYSIELSTRPENRIGSNELWDKTERILKEILVKSKNKFKVNEGDGAFYGPKIDFHIKDSLDRTWQCGTIQLDFALPERFELEYIDKNNKIKRPIMIHRTIYGSIERFIGILLEHTKGNLPTWLAPIQVRVINFTDRNIKSCNKFIEKLRTNISNIRIDSDFESVPLQKKIRKAELMRIPYIIVIGDKEEKEESIAIRRRGSNKIENLSIEKFIKEIFEQIKEKK